MTHKIRFAEKKDIPDLVRLCELHAIYEKCAYDSEGKVTLLSKSLFIENSPLFCLVVEQENKIAGYATYMEQFSTWTASTYVYMDCLFLEESTRNLGIGAELIQKIQQEAKKLGALHIEWQTPKFNVRAIKFYKRIGGVSTSKERFSLAL